MKKATIYDVAREAGVSLATVSRVINGSSVVREKTKEKVMKVIDELNFKPNQIARGLATNKTTTIAVIFPQSLFAHVKDMIGGIGDAGRTLDYNITIYTTDDIGNGPMDDVMEKVIRTRADGVILFNNDKILIKHLAARGGQDAHDGPADGGLARTGLAHQTEGLAFIDGEVCVLDGLVSLAAGAVGHFEVFYLDQNFAFVCHVICPPLAASAQRRAVLFWVRGGREATSWPGGSC